MSDHQDAVAKVAELAKGIRIAMVTTIDEDGHLVARPMAQQEVEFDGDLWFFAERNSSAVTQLQANPHVGVSLSSNDTWVSICGTAELVHDLAKAKDLCGPTGPARAASYPLTPSRSGSTSRRAANSAESCGPSVRSCATGGTAAAVAESACAV